jgi:hypothetical protein
MDAEQFAKPIEYERLAQAVYQAILLREDQSIEIQHTVGIARRGSPSVLSLPRFRGHQVWRGCSPGGLHGIEADFYQGQVICCAAAAGDSRQSSHIHATEARAGYARCFRLFQIV